MKSKKNDILERIKLLEEAITKGREYLETGEHAHWHGFRPLFAHKVRNGKILPPHKDWVKNVFLPGHEKALSKAQKTLENRDRIREQDFPRYGSKLAARES
jgi:hypothetical protein